MAEIRSFGGWLRHRRRELDLTQEELARQVGCAPITIRKIESDQMRPSKQMTELLMDQLQVAANERENFRHFARGGELAKSISVTVPRDNLPHPISTFIGREREIENIKRLIGMMRLVTLIGAGGCGKSRLAIEAAGQMLDLFPDGVWFVEFAPITDSTLVHQTIASALKVRENPDHPLIETLCAYLVSKQLLLVFDNCEHLIEECASAADTLLQACAQLHILATSREVLKIEGEEQYYVPCLTLPGAEPDFPIEKLSQSESVRLFVNRAALVQPEFSLTAENSSPIAKICQRLDGMPLAIELAAARVKVLTVEQIAEHLNDRFKLLTSGNRTTLPRHQTLRATIEWSYNALPKSTQMLFCRLSVFAGGFTQEAVQAVCSDESPALDEILPEFSRLVDRSLVEVAQIGNDKHFRMLETIRQYAQEKLEESGETRQVRGRHLNYFLAWGEQAELGFRGRDFQLWLDRMDKERDNLRTALDYAINSGQSESALRLIGSTFWVWFIRGPWSEGQRWAEATLNGAPHKHTAVRAKALMALGILHFSQTDYLKAHKSLEKSLAIWQKLEDEWWCAFATSMLGYCIHRENQPAASRLLREAVQIAREVNDKWLLALCLSLLGANEFYQGNLVDGHAMAEESLGLIRALGDHMIRCDVLCLLGEIADSEQDYPRALRFYEEGLAVAREIEDPDSIANLEFDMGRVYQISGDNDRAASLFRETLQVSLQAGKKSTLTGALAGLGVVALARGDSSRAVRLFQSSESLFDSLQKRIFMDSMDRAWFEQHLAAARAQLGKEKFFALAKQGQAMTLEQAVKYALEEM